MAVSLTGCQSNSFNNFVTVWFSARYRLTGKNAKSLARYLLYDKMADFAPYKNRARQVFRSKTDKMADRLTGVLAVVKIA